MVDMDDMNDQMRAWGHGCCMDARVLVTVVMCGGTVAVALMQVFPHELDDE